MNLKELIEDIDRIKELREKGVKTNMYGGSESGEEWELRYLESKEIQEVTYEEE